MKIILNKNQKLWITSDTHYNHKNIVRGVTDWKKGEGEVSTRDFETIEEMSTTIVNNINSVVGKNDILIHLGDWSFGGKDSIADLREKINCKTVHLVTGNHDEHIEANKHVLTHYRDLQSGEIVRGEYEEPIEDKFGTNLDNKVYLQEFFTTVQKYLEVEVRYGTEKYDKLKLVLFHFPIASWNNMARGAIHLHGHVHFSVDKKMQKGKMMDVGVDGNNLYPYDILEIKEIMKRKPIKSLFEYDHHEIVENYRK